VETTKQNDKGKRRREKSHMPKKPEEHGGMAQHHHCPPANDMKFDYEKNNMSTWICKKGAGKRARVKKDHGIQSTASESTILCTNLED
jgi:hypothetical protein